MFRKIDKLKKCKVKPYFLRYFPIFTPAPRGIVPGLTEFVTMAKLVYAAKNAVRKPRYPPRTVR